MRMREEYEAELRASVEELQALRQREQVLANNIIGLQRVLQEIDAEVKEDGKRNSNGGD